MVAAAYITSAVQPPAPRLQVVDRQGNLTSPALQMLQQMFSAINGLTPTVACTTTFSSNKYTLTPFVPAPEFKNYNDYWSFAFVAPNTSTGAVTATVVPTTGTAATLKVYIANGRIQAGADDIVANRFYIMTFVDTLDGGAGGFVIDIPFHSVALTPISVAAVSGTGDDTTINNNFAIVVNALNDIIDAVTA